MVRKTLFLLGIMISLFAKSQHYAGKIFLQDTSSLYLNQIYVTNVTAQQSVLSNYDGSFSIAAKAGDVVRFTSITTERADVGVTQQMLASDKNLVHLQMATFNIQEVVLHKFKPSGNIRKDIKYFKDQDKNLEIAKIIGLPGPTTKDETVLPPLASFGGGSLNLDLASLFEIISGEREKKIRAYNYEKMSRTVAAIRKYYGDEYFLNLKIPKNHIDNFLQFIYNSDNVESSVSGNNLEATKYYIEKYLPVYLKRMQDSAYRS